MSQNIPLKLFVMLSLLSSSEMLAMLNNSIKFGGNLSLDIKI